MPSFEEELTRIIRKQPSDLYILPHDRYYQLSLAIKGTLFPFKQVTCDYGQRFISYLKYCANMAVSEHRRPQLGALNLLMVTKRSIYAYQVLVIIKEGIISYSLYISLNDIRFNF